VLIYQFKDEDHVCLLIKDLRASYFFTRHRLE